MLGKNVWVLYKEDYGILDFSDTLIMNGHGEFIIFWILHGKQSLRDHIISSAVH